MKLRKHGKYVLIFLILIFTVSFGIIIATGKSPMSLLGKDQAEILSSEDDLIIASVDGEKISEHEFRVYKSSLANVNNNYSDDEILEKMIDSRVLYKKSFEEGIIVLDEEVEKVIQESKDALAQNTDQGQQIRDYFEGMNLTEDEYYDLVRPLVKRTMAIGRLKIMLKKTLLKNIT